LHEREFFREIVLRHLPKRIGFICCALLSGVLCAQEAQHVDALPAGGSTQVVLDGRPIFEVAGSASFPSSARAHAVRTRIVDIARNPAVRTDDIQAAPGEGRIDLRAGSRHLVAVVDADAKLEGLSLSDTAQLRLSQIRQAIDRYRAERSPGHTTRAIINSVLVAGAACLALIGILFALRRLNNLFEMRYRARIHSLTIQSFEVVRAEQIWRAVRGGLHALRLLLVGGIAYFTLVFVLGQFPSTRGLGADLLSVIADPVVRMATAVFEYIPKLIFLLVLVLVIRYALKLMHVFSRAVAAGTVPVPGFDADWAQPTYHIMRALIILLALVIAYPYLPGSGSAAFQGLSIFAGLMLSLGASSAMASVIAGYTVTYRRAFRVGDRVSIGDLTGEVTEVRLMVTHLRTPKNEEIVVPNSLVLASHVTNYSKLAATQGLLLHTIVRIGYSTPWRQVEALLLQAAARTTDLTSTRPAFVLEKSLDEFSVAYELNVCVDSAQHLLERYAALHRNILDVFNEYGVQIMVPAYEGDTPEPKIVPRERWFTAPAPAPEQTVLTQVPEAQQQPAAVR
jgi:small-conductance mechanosensitive channel